MKTSPIYTILVLMLFIATSCNNITEESKPQPVKSSITAEDKAVTATAKRVTTFREVSQKLIEAVNVQDQAAKVSIQTTKATANVTIITPKSEKDSVQTIIQIYRDSTNLKHQVPLADKIPLDGYGENAYISSYTPSYRKRYFSIETKCKEYCNDIGVEYNRFKVDSYLKEYLTDPSFLNLTGLDTLINRRVEVFDTHSGISFIGRIKSFRYYRDGGGNYFAAIVPFTDELKSTLKKLSVKIDRYGRLYNKLRFLLPQDNYDKSDRFLTYEIWEFPSNFRLPVLSKEVSDAVINHLTKNDTTHTFQVDSLKLLKALPGDVNGNLNFYSFTYTLNLGKDVKEWSIIAMNNQGKIIVLDTGIHFNPYRNPELNEFTGPYKTGEKVTLTGVIDLDRDGIYEIGIMTSKASGSYHEDFSTERYWSFTGIVRKLIWGHSEGGAC